MMVYPEDIERKIDFSLIRQMLSGACSSVLGRERVDTMTFMSDYDAISRALEETREMKALLEDGSLDFPRGEINDVREALGRIRIEGLYLDEAELFALRKTLDYASRLAHFLMTLDEHRFPLLKRSREITLDNVVKMIDRVIDKYGKVADSASPELGRIRYELVKAQGSVGRALANILRQAQADGIVDKDASPTLREGRLVIPVPPAYKRKIGGIVHDESATGKTVYIEPAQVVEANNHIRELEGEEHREKIRILLELTANLRPHVPDILSTNDLLAWVDFLVAKVRLAQELKAIAPQMEDRPFIDWKNARHPVLYLNFKKQGKTVVPLNLMLGVEKVQRVQEVQKVLDTPRVLVISGPNAGGKSVCLKTVALIQYMVQCGLLVPLDEGSQMGVFERLMIDIGDEQSIEDDLSTYSSHLRNMKMFVHHANERTLLLIDEFGTGTEPLIGGAIAESVLQRLTEQGAFGVITTHYTNLKHFAEQTPAVINGAMLYDRGQLKPLFQLSVGQAGSSFAIEIAKQIGLPEDIIAHATELVGAEHIDYDKQLQVIARDKRYWENKRQNIRQREKHLEEKIAFYESEIAGLKAKKKEIIAQANQQASDILQQSNATIERTIREIKEAKADKVKTQEARKQVENLKNKVEKVPEVLKVEKDKRKVLHDFRDLKAIGKQMPSVQPSVVNTIRERKMAFELSLDLRGYRADEALETFIAYLDDAIMVNAGTVTILHGTGTGALKQIVRDHLAARNRDLKKRHAGEIVYHDGDPDRGGAGITVIEL